MDTNYTNHLKKISCKFFVEFKTSLFLCCILNNVSFYVNPGPQGKRFNTCIVSNWVSRVKEEINKQTKHIIAPIIIRLCGIPTKQMYIHIAQIIIRLCLRHDSRTWFTRQLMLIFRLSLVANRLYQCYAFDKLFGFHLHHILTFMLCYWGVAV